MSCFFQQLSSRSAVMVHRRIVGATGFSPSPWSRIIDYSAVSGRVYFQSAFARLRLHCYSSSATTSAPSPPPKRKSRSRKSQKKSTSEEKEAFYVVRKGDLVGVYRTLNDCQAQLGKSICDPPVSVYKGYSMPNDSEDYLRSRGLHNALYTLKASDLNEVLFGNLVPCSFQEPEPSSVTGESINSDLPKESPSGISGSEPVVDRSISAKRDMGGKQVKLDYVSSDSSCILEFDGASKGNPGEAGAGVVLRNNDGSLICKLHQGLGVATCNAAEYRAIILGLKSALERGYTSIRVQGDSKLVCMQLQDLWKVRNEHLSILHEEAKKLKEKFSLFQISHVLRALNSDADAQANLGIKLASGQIEEDYSHTL